MEEKEVLQKLVGIIETFLDDTSILKNAGRDTHLIDDLNVNSAWIVDFIIKIEDAFDIEITDDDADGIQTLGNAIDIIQMKMAEAQNVGRRMAV